jgi:hypothetical protein
LQWFCEVSDQPVSRLGLKHGRLCVATTWFAADDTTVRQSDEFLSVASRLTNWMSRLMNWIKPTRLYAEQADWYGSSRAHEILEAEVVANRWRDEWHIVIDEPTASDTADRVAA